MLLQLLKVVMAPESKFIGIINHYRVDPSGWIGSAIMLVFASVAGYRWHTSGLIFFGLLVVRDLAASWFLISRNPSKERANSRWNEILAYISSAWPFMYVNPLHSLQHAGLVSSVLVIAGFSISTLAVFDLGSSFGVSPANRGIVRSGIYRYVRHPMYSGYAISEFGFIFLNPYNLFLWIPSVILYFVRTKREDQVLNL